MKPVLGDASSDRGGRRLSRLTISCIAEPGKAEQHERPSRRLGNARRDARDDLNAGFGHVNRGAVKNKSGGHGLSLEAGARRRRVAPVVHSRKQAVLKYDITIVAGTKVECDLCCGRADVRALLKDNGARIHICNGKGCARAIELQIPAEEIGSAQQPRVPVRRQRANHAAGADRLVDRLDNVRRRGFYAQQRRVKNDA
jgi:hypothetical protein